MNATIRALSAVVMLMACAVCFAHKQSDSYLTLKVDKQTLQGQWDIALRDLDLAVGLDADADERIIWREVRTQRAAIERYAFDRLHITTAANGKSLPWRKTALLVAALAAVDLRPVGASSS